MIWRQKEKCSHQFPSMSTTISVKTNNTPAAILPTFSQKLMELTGELLTIAFLVGISSVHCNFRWDDLMKFTSFNWRVWKLSSIESFQTVWPDNHITSASKNIKWVSVRSKSSHIAASVGQRHKLCTKFEISICL